MLHSVGTVRLQASLRGRPSAHPLRNATAAAPGRPRRCLFVPRAEQKNVADDVAKQAQEFARRTSQNMSDFVRQQELDKKAAAAYEDASQQLRTSYMRLDAEWDLAGRWNNLQGRLSEKVQDIDQQFNLRRKVRATVEDVGRMAPLWKRQLAEFSSTTQGKATLTLLFVGLLLSGTLFKLLNLIWLGWWVSVPLSLFLANQQRQKQREERQQAAQRATGSSRDSSSWDRTGPVVEAEWVSLDDDRGKVR